MHSRVRLMASVLAACITLGSVQQVYAEAGEPCPIPEWRRAAIERKNQTMVDVSEVTQPLSGRTAGSRSCLPVFQNLGVSISGSIPTTLGGLFKSLITSVINKVCDAANNWISGQMKEIHEGIMGPLGSVPGFSGGVSGSGFEYDWDASGAVKDGIEDAIEDGTGLDTDIPVQSESGRVSTDILRTL